MTGYGMKMGTKIITIDSDDNAKVIKDSKLMSVAHCLFMGYKALTEENTRNLKHVLLDLGEFANDIDWKLPDRDNK
jgi:hypothetical protein